MPTPTLVIVGRRFVVLFFLAFSEVVIHYIALPPPSGHGLTYLPFSLNPLKSKNLKSNAVLPSLTSVSYSLKYFECPLSFKFSLSCAKKYFFFSWFSSRDKTKTL